MPFGPGTYAGGGGAGLAGPAASRQGIPQPGVTPAPAPDEQVLSELIQMLRGGQVGAEKFLQLLELLAGSTVPQMGQPGQPQGPQQIGPQAGPAALLGG